MSRGLAELQALHRATTELLGALAAEPEALAEAVERRRVCFEALRAANPTQGDPGLAPWLDALAGLDAKIVEVAERGRTRISEFLGELETARQTARAFRREASSGEPRFIAQRV